MFKLVIAIGYFDDILLFVCYVLTVLHSTTVFFRFFYYNCNN